MPRAGATYAWPDLDYLAVFDDGKRLATWGSVVYDIESGATTGFGPSLVPSTLEPLRPLLQAEGVDPEILTKKPAPAAPGRIAVEPAGAVTVADGGATCCTASESFRFAPILSRSTSIFVASVQREVGAAALVALVSMTSKRHARTSAP